MFNIFAIMDNKCKTLFELDMNSVPYEDQQQMVQNAIDSIMNLADLDRDIGSIPEPIVVTFINRGKDGTELYLPYFIATPIDGSKSWFVDLLAPKEVLGKVFQK